MRPSTAGCCWSQAGRVAQHFCGLCYRRWRSASSRKIAFNTSYFVSLLLKDRLFGFAAAAFDLTAQGGVPVDAHFIPLTQLAPGRLLSSPGLWLGLAAAAALLAAAVRLRRYQGPI
jgi:hypothetical protein